MQYSPLICQKAKRHLDANSQLTQKDIECIFQRVIPMSASKGCQHRLTNKIHSIANKIVPTRQVLCVLKERCSLECNLIPAFTRSYYNTEEIGIKIVRRKLPGYSIRKRRSGPNEKLVGCCLIPSLRALLR